jgi:hypothetical protein
MASLHAAALLSSALSRQASLGEEEVGRPKPFGTILLVANPTWQSLVSSQKRVLHAQG